MTIFDYLNSILYSKNYIELNCDEESQFNSFMINRWVSFYSPELCCYINETGNKQAHIFTDKQEQFNYYYNVIPKIRFKKINYIKKASKEAKTEEQPIIPEFISSREYKNYVEFNKELSI